MALGARPEDLLRIVVGQGMRVALLGVALGALGAAMRRLTMLFGVSPTDPIVFSSVCVLLALVALVATWVPARRASRVDPVTALRCD